MRSLPFVACVVLAACGGSRPAAPVPVTAVEVAQPEPRPRSYPSDTVVASSERRAALLRELEAVDREIDALDDEVAAAATAVTPASRREAIAAVETRIRQLEATTVVAIFEGAPAVLEQLATQRILVFVRDSALAADLGPQHPERVALRLDLAWLDAAFEHQRARERAFARGWRDELAKLPAEAPPRRVELARLRALSLELATSSTSDDGIVPSEVRAEVRVAAARIRELGLRRAQLARELGPRNPELIAAEQQLLIARLAYRDAVVEASDALLRTLLELEAGRTPAAVDPSRLARRASLADRSRELRRAWDALR